MRLKTLCASVACNYGSKIKMAAAHVARVEEVRRTFKILTTKGKRTLGRSRRRWEDSIRMNLKEIVVNTRNLDD